MITFQKYHEAQWVMEQLRKDGTDMKLTEVPDFGGGRRYALASQFQHASDSKIAKLITQYRDERHGANGRRKDGPFRPNKKVPIQYKRARKRGQETEG